MHSLRRVALLLIAIVAVAIPVRAYQVLDRFREFCGQAAALAHEHSGLPVEIAPRQAVGSYDVALWARPDVGAGMVYVVMVPRDDRPFVAPRAVRVNLRASTDSGRGQWYDAHAEPVRHGSRFVTAVALDHADTWAARIVIDGPAGPITVATSLTSVAPASPSAASAVLSLAPFLLVAGLWGRGRRLRQSFAQKTAGNTPVTLTQQIVT